MSINLNFDHEALIDQISGKIAARAIDELRRATSQRAEVADAWLVMDTFGHSPRENGNFSATCVEKSEART